MQVLKESGCVEEVLNYLYVCYFLKPLIISLEDYRFIGEFESIIYIVGAILKN